MADYHIYLHSNEKQSLASHTQPKEEVMDGAFSSNLKSAFGQAQTFATSGFSSYIQTGVAALSKAIPFVAAVVVAAKITDKVLTTGFGHLESYTGHYEYAMGYNNFKTNMNMAINPIGTLIRQTHIDKQNEMHNKRQNEIRSLYGEQKVGV